MTEACAENLVLPVCDGDFVDVAVLVGPGTGVEKILGAGVVAACGGVWLAVDMGIGPLAAVWVGGSGVAFVVTGVTYGFVLIVGVGVGVEHPEATGYGLEAPVGVELYLGAAGCGGLARLGGYDDDAVGSA